MRPCLFCKAETPSQHRPSKARRFCSISCWYKYRNAGTARACVVCGEIFTGKWKEIKTCGRKCGGVLRSKQVRTSCAICGKETIAPRSQARKYCSKKCNGIALRVPETPLRDGNFFVLKCFNCGVTFKRIARKQTRHKGRSFCSKECMSKGNRGASHALFRGDRRHWRGPDWSMRQKEAREMDGHTCQYIGCEVATQNKQKIGVDHIIPFRLHHSNDIENLMCICRSHHAQKTQAENFLLKGDWISFERTLNRVGCPLDRLEKAKVWWGNKPQLPIPVLPIRVLSPKKEKLNG